MISYWKFSSEKVKFIYFAKLFTDKSGFLAVNPAYVSFFKTVRVVAHH
jgi:hypothetical protein